jgi:hypothetical protein
MESNNQTLQQDIDTRKKARAIKKAKIEFDELEKK